MKKQIKAIVTAALILALSLSLMGCSEKPLPEGFDADELGTAAEEIVGLAIAGDYDSIIGALREDLKSTITADQLEEGWAPVYEKAGAFVSVTKATQSGSAASTARHVRLDHAGAWPPKNRPSGNSYCPSHTIR